MNFERPENFSEPRLSGDRQTSDDKQDVESTVKPAIAATAAPREAAVPARRDHNNDQKNPNASGNDLTNDSAKDSSPKNQEATILVRGETISNQDSNSTQGSPNEKEKSPPKPVSEAKVKMQSRLPALDDDAEVGVPKEQVVTRDGKADLAFTGTLLASAAPASAPHGRWQEYRIYETNGGKHVFSKVSRSVFAEQRDTHEAEVFDPAPSSVPSKLLRSARDLTHSHPMTWADAAVAFFGYDPLAKALYRQLGAQFEEHIS